MNMSYCRFQNTLGDLRDCFEAWDEVLSPEEAHAKQKLIEVCQSICIEENCQEQEDENENEED